MPGYVTEFDAKAEICGETHLTKKTIHIGGKGINMQKEREILASALNIEWFIRDMPFIC